MGVYWGGGGCNVWCMYVCMGFVMCGCVYVWILKCVGVRMCGFYNVWLCVCVGFVMRGCVFGGAGVVMCGVCMYVWVL